MGAPSHTRINVLRLIADAPEPIDSRAIRAHETMRDEDDVRVSSILYNIKKDDLVVIDDRRRYSITARGRALLAARGQDASVARPAVKEIRLSIPQPRTAAAAKRKKPNLSKNAVVATTLEKLRDEAQNALDVYLCSVGDPMVYEPLKRARDEALAAIKSYGGRGTGEEG